MFRCLDHTQEAAIYTKESKRKKRMSIPSAEFEPKIPEIEVLQTSDLDRTATGIGLSSSYRYVHRSSINHSIPKPETGQFILQDVLTNEAMRFGKEIT